MYGGGGREGGRKEGGGMKGGGRDYLAYPRPDSKEGDFPVNVPA